MKTAMIAMLPALLLCSAAQAQLGGVTDTAGSAVRQAGDPAVAGEFGRNGAGLNSRFGGPNSRIDSLRARQAEGAARQASQTATVEAQSQTLIRSQAEAGSAMTGTGLAASTKGEAAAGASAEAALPASARLDAAVRQQLAEIQAASIGTTELASPQITPTRLATAAPAPARITYVQGSTAPAYGYRTVQRDTVIVRQDPAPARPRQRAAADIRLEPQSQPSARPGPSIGSPASDKVWPITLAGLLIAVLLGLTGLLGRRQRAA
jgi:hypothetical protein